ncbi:MAG: tetratricopeptide repeat protein [Bacteroidales bacterium]|nr:tetratricopeptide repeat protein [Bacteroidales bacterium]
MKILRYILLTALVALAAAPKANAQSEAFLEAIRLYYSNDVRAAYTQLKKVIAAEPDNDAAYFYLHTMLRDSTAAENMLKKAVDLDGENYWYNYSLAQNYIRQKKYEEAAEILERLLAEYPKKTNIYSDLIGVYTESKQYDKAMDALDKIEGKVGSSDVLASIRTEILMAQGKMQEAYDYMLGYFGRTGSPRAACFLGQYNAAGFNNQEALRFYDAALEANPFDSEALYGKAHVHRSLGQYDLYFENIMPFLGNPEIMPQAKTEYMAGVLGQQQFVYTFAPQVDTMMMTMYASAPADSSICSLTSTYLFQRGQVDAALDLAKSNADNYPESYQLNFTYPFMQYYCSDYAGATGSATVALQRFPNDVDLLQLRGMCFWQLGELDSALEDYLAALKQGQIKKDNGTQLACYSSLGDLYHLKGDQKTAFSYYEKALKIDPNSSPVLNNYAYYISEKYPTPVAKVPKELKKALAMSRKTIEKEPDNATYLDTYAWILHLMGQDLEAKAHFKHAMIHGGKESGVMLRHYATVLRALGENDLANIYQQQAKGLGE